MLSSTSQAACCSSTMGCQQRLVPSGGVTPHLSTGRPCSYVGLGGVLLVDGGGVPWAVPLSGGQALEPVRTTATVECSWLEMHCGVCRGWVGQHGGAPHPGLPPPIPVWPGDVNLVWSTSHTVGWMILPARSPGRHSVLGGRSGGASLPCLGPVALAGWQLGRLWPLGMSCGLTPYLWEEE